MGSDAKKTDEGLSAASSEHEGRWQATGAGQLIVVAGPTASGKSELSVQLAKHFDGFIVNADSRQVYRELNIGVAKPSPAQLAEVPHYLVGNASIREPYSAGAWARQARKAVEVGFAERRTQTMPTAIISGGTGLYINALTHGIPDMPQVSAELQNSFDERLQSQGLEVLLDELSLLDHDYYHVVDKANARRVTRALSVMAAAGGPTFTQLRARPANPCPYPVTTVILEPDRRELYARIERRVDEMVSAGLKREAILLDKFRGLRAVQTIGYQEWWPTFDGVYDDARAIELIKQGTRQYARRQLTWNRKLEGLRFATPNFDAVISRLQQENVPGT